MKRILTLILLFFQQLNVSAQNKYRTMDQLIDPTNSTWTSLKASAKVAKNKVEVLKADPVKAKEELLKMQVTTRSPLGSIVYYTGGMIIDNGWIRIPGSGNGKAFRSITDWNTGKSITEAGKPPSFVLIADDAIGGFFVLNGGAYGKDVGKVYYFSPDNLNYEPLDQTYSDFLSFCFNGDLDKFYEGYRWKTWRTDVEKLGYESVFTFYPPLWTKEGKEINNDIKKIIPVEEQYGYNWK